MKLPRPEYPRPQFERLLINLNGQWTASMTTMKELNKWYENLSLIKR